MFSFAVGIAVIIRSQKDPLEIRQIVRHPLRIDMENSRSVVLQQQFGNIPAESFGSSEIPVQLFRPYLIVRLMTPDYLSHGRTDIRNILKLRSCPPETGL